MFVKIKNLVAKSISRFGVENQINKIKTCEISKKIIYKNFPAGVIKKFNVKNNGILEITCGNSIFAGELMLKNNLIINKINQELDKDLPKIECIRLKIY